VFFDPAFSTGGQVLDRWLALLEQCSTFLV
jgi:hypothetical protein